MQRLHNFAEEIEKVFVCILFLVIGVFFAAHYKLLFNSWTIVLSALALILIIRPVAGYISLLGTPLKPIQKHSMAFFGIRGLGSIFYLMYAFTKHEFQEEQGIEAFVLIAMLFSVIIHGITAFFIMKKLELVEKET